MINARFAETPFIRCGKDVSYCRRLRDAIDAKGEVKTEVRSWKVDSLTSPLRAVIYCTADRIVRVH